MNLHLLDWSGWACFWRGRHDPTRHFIGGFRCVDCGALGADMAEMGFPDEDHVSVQRHIYTRGRDGGSERTYEWPQ